MAIAYVDVNAQPARASNSGIIRTIIPQGFALFIVGAGDGAMKHKIREFASALEASECANFFAEHWHDPRASFEVWSNGQCVYIARPHDPEQELEHAGELYGHTRG